MSTLKELMALQSTESQKLMVERVEKMRRDVFLSQLRNELQIYQSELAAAIG